jgi:hypothetical protein
MNRSATAGVHQLVKSSGRHKPRAALGRIMRAVSEGAMTPAEGAQLAAIVNSYTAAIDMADVVKRVDALEAQLKDFRR